MFLDFIFVFLGSIDHNKVTHIRRIYHWFLARTHWLESVDPIGLCGVLINLSTTFIFSVLSVLSVTFFLSLKNQRFQILLQIFRLCQLSSFPELDDQVGVLTDFSLRLERVVPFFLQQVGWPEVTRLKKYNLHSAVWHAGEDRGKIAVSEYLIEKFLLWWVWVFNVNISIQRLVGPAGENCALQVASLTELNPETSSLPGVDSLPQLTVGHREAAVPVLWGHLVLVVESHSVGGAASRGAIFLLHFYLLLLLWAATTKRDVSSAFREVLLLQNVWEGK